MENNDKLREVAKSLTMIGEGIVEGARRLEHAFDKMGIEIIINPPAVIMFRNGKKYVAKCHPDDEFNAEIGIMMCFVKSCGYKYNEITELVSKAKVQTPKS